MFDPTFRRIWTPIQKSSKALELEKFVKRTRHSGVSFDDSCPMMKRQKSLNSTTAPTDFVLNISQSIEITAKIFISNSSTIHKQTIN